MIPVLIIGYKRVKEFSQLLQKCLESGAKEIYVAIDAEDSENNTSKNLQFEQIIADISREFPESKVNSWYRKMNLGSSLSVISAIEWAFQYEESLAILEDDLEISEHLLDFFTDQVEVLELSEKDLMVTGSNTFRGRSGKELSGYSHYPVVWGWATTRKKWVTMKEGMLSSNYRFEPSTKRMIRNFLEAGRTRALSRLIDAWDVPLAAFMKAHGFRCLIPSVNLVSNIGFDENATHTKSKKWPLGVDIEIINGFETSYSQNYDAQMESLILGIKRRHVFSRVKLKISTRMKKEEIQNYLLQQDLLRIEIPVSGIDK